MSEEKGLRIDGLMKQIEELRSISFKALEIAQQKEGKLFGNEEKTEQCKPIAGGLGLIGEASSFVAITIDNIIEIVSFLEKL